MGFVWFLAGAIVGYFSLILVYFFSRKRKNTSLKEVLIMLNLESGKTANLVITGRDSAGNVTAIPTGATVAWSISDTVGTGSGVLTQDVDPTILDAVLAAGPAGDAGVLTAVVTVPDGTIYTTPAFEFTDTAGALASVEIEVKP